MCKRLKDGTFHEERDSSIALKTFSIDRELDDQQYKLFFIDSPGQLERFEMMAQFLREPTVVLILFDPTDSNLETLKVEEKGKQVDGKKVSDRAKSTDSIDGWIEYVNDNSNAPYVLVGTHKDLISDDKPFDQERFAKKHNAEKTFLISNKDGSGFDDLLDYICRVGKERTARGGIIIDDDKLPKSSPKPKCC